MRELDRVEPKLTEPDCPLESAALVYFDLETTGLHPERGATVTEAAILDGGGMRFRWERDRSDDPFGAVLPKLLEHLAAGVVVGHNLKFDFGFLAYEAARRDLSGPDVRYLDTLALSRRIDEGRCEYQLETLARDWELDVDGRLHTAPTDTRVTRELLWELVDRGDLKTLDDAGLSRLDWSAV